MAHGFSNGRLIADQATLNRSGVGEFIKCDDGTNNFQMFSSDGSPEGVVAADIGSTSHDITNGNLYIKTTDTVNTGWLPSSSPEFQDAGWIWGVNGGTYNIGMTYSSPTFTITGANGSALSAANPGYVSIQNNSDLGRRTVYKITSNTSFDDDSGTSDLIGNLWSTTSGTAWDEEMPFFVYAVAKTDNTAATFMISRVPNRTTAPVAGKIAKSGSAVATTQGSMFAIDSGITVGDYAGGRCAMVGFLEMKKNDAANDDWTVTDVAGMGQIPNASFYLFPEDQMGATDTYLSKENGADTLPIIASANIAAGYKIGIDGFCDFTCGWTNIGTGGSGTAGALRFHVPFNIGYNASWYSPPGNMQWLNSGASTYDTLQPFVYIASGTTESYFEFLKNGAGTTKLRPGDMITDHQNGSFGVRYLINNG